MTTDEFLTTRFEEDRAHLRGVAYRLLGSMPDAEDAVQTAWLKVSQADLGEVRNLTGWFTTVTARECLDQLRARKRRGEVPLPGDDAAALSPDLSADLNTDEEIVLAESVGLALQVVLDRLSPAQRVAFVLHDLFAVPFDDIARLLDRSPIAAKKLASRARERVHGQPVADRQLASEHFPIVEAFLNASRGGDLPVLLELLAPDVVRHVDPVLVPDGIAAEVRGAHAVAEETRLFAARARIGVVALVDGAPGIVIAPQGRLRIALRLRIHAGRIHTIDVIGDPERLDRLTIAFPDWRPR